MWSSTETLLALIAALGILGAIGVWVYRARGRRGWQARSEARDRAQSLIDAIDAIVWEGTPDPLEFAYVSAGAEDISGWSRRMWTRKGFVHKLVHPEDLGRVLSFYSKVAHREEAARIEYRIRTPEGRTLWLSDSATAHRSREQVVVLRGRMVEVTPHKRAEQRLAAVLAAQQGITRAETLREMAGGVLKTLCEALDWPFGALWRLEPGAELLHCFEVWHAGSQDLEYFASVSKELTFKRGAGLPGRVFERLDAVWIRDVVSDDSPRAPYADKVGLHTAFGFPILVGEEFFGVFEFFSREVEEPDEEMLKMGANLGSHIGEWLGRKQAQDQILFQKALMESQSEGGIEGIMIVSGDGRILSMNRRFRELWDIDEDLYEDSEIIRQVLAQIEDAGSALERVSELHENKEQKYRGEVSLRDGRVFDLWTSPIVDEQGRIHGRGWYFRDISLGRRSETALRQSRERLQFLSEAGKVLSATLGYEETVDAIATLAVPALADWCAVDFVERSDRVIRVSAHREGGTVKVSEPVVRRLDKQATLGPDHVILRGESEVHTRAGSGLLAAVGELSENPSVSENTSALVVPLQARGEVRGVLTLIRSDPKGPYGSDELFLAEALARRASLALDNAVLYEERSRIASTLQESLKPPAVPGIPGVDIAARYVAAGEASEVGGDFYDVFPYGERRWAIVIGDVSGKGPRAAALMGMVRHTVRLEAAQEREPRRILSMLNEALFTEADEDQFCSLAYTRLELGNGTARLTIVSAGHPPPILVRRGGKTELLLPSGPVLGLQRHVEFGEHLVDLRPGEGIFFYTDGVIEARSESGLLGIDRLRSIVAAKFPMEASQLVEIVEAKATSFAEELRDDMALVAFKLKG